MGQPIVVIERPSVANPGMVRFETNRSITGMGHEVYPAGTEVRGERAPDELALRLLAHDSVAAIHMNGSVVTVDLEKGMTSAGLKEVIEGLYIHYPATEDEAAPEDASAPESEGEVVEAEAAAPAEAAPEPSHEEPAPSAEVSASESAGPAPEEAAEAPAASSSDAVADPGEETEADVAAAEGDAPTADNAPVGASPSDPPADDPAAAPSPSAAEDA